MCRMQPAHCHFKGMPCPLLTLCLQEMHQLLSLPPPSPAIPMGVLLSLRVTHLGEVQFLPPPSGEPVAHAAWCAIPSAATRGCLCTCHGLTGLCYAPVFTQSFGCDPLGVPDPHFPQAPMRPQQLQDWVFGCQPPSSPCELQPVQLRPDCHGDSPFSGSNAPREDLPREDLQRGRAAWPGRGSID